MASGSGSGGSGFGGKKGRSEEEVLAEFSGVTAPVNVNIPVPDNEVGEANTRGAITSGYVAVAAPAQIPGMAPGAPITMENIMLMMVDALAKIAAGQTNAQMVATQALDQAARQQQPDNRFAPGISVYNPQGDLQYPRPKLKCPMFIPWEAEEESATFEEIELLNLLESGDYSVKRNDETRVPVTVKISMNNNGKADRLLMNSETSFNDDNHWMMPGLTVILRQILATRPHTKLAAAKILTMDERMDMVMSGELPCSVGVR